MNQWRQAVMLIVIFMLLHHTAADDEAAAAGAGQPATVSSPSSATGAQHQQSNALPPPTEAGTSLTTTGSSKAKAAADTAVEPVADEPEATSSDKAANGKLAVAGEPQAITSQSKLPADTAAPFGVADAPAAALSNKTAAAVGNTAAEDASGHTAKAQGVTNTAAEPVGDRSVATDSDKDDAADSKLAVPEGTQTAAQSKLPADNAATTGVVDPPATTSSTDTAAAADNIPAADAAVDVAVKSTAGAAVRSQQAAAGAGGAAAAGAGEAATAGAGEAAAASTSTAALADDDVSAAGACREYITSLCEDVQPGEGRVADCLSQAQSQSPDAEESAGASTPELSDQCSEEVMQFNIARDNDISKNAPLAKACQSDIVKFCSNMTLNVGSMNSSTIYCLRGVRAKLQLACKKMVFQLQRDASYDYRADPSLRKACQSDVDRLCGKVEPGEGRVQACLRENHMKLTWGCATELYRKDIEDSDDIRLSVRLFKACLSDKQQFCADVPPGHALAKQCLEEHRAELSAECRSEIDGMIERRVRDFRLDSRLKKACEQDINDVCATMGDLDSLDTGYTSMVINCLQDYYAAIKGESCKSQVHKYLELAAEDLRFDVSLADACYKDRVTLCAKVPPGDARVIRCLQQARDQLSATCKAKLLKEEELFSENIDFQYPMKQACLKEIDRFCKDVPHGQARVIRCLQDQKSHKDFSKGCRMEVQRYEQESARDYRLNYRLYKECKRDISQVCQDACQLKEGELCGGKVLNCLSDNMERIQAEGCLKEVSFLVWMEVQDFRADMQLAEACRSDVMRLCAKVEPGEGRVHQCLRANVKQLSSACRQQEMRLEEKEEENVQLNVGLLRACVAERKLFCRAVQPGGARVFRCLAENMASADFGKACKTTIKQKLERREANWRLDPPLRKACQQDVKRLCSANEGQHSDPSAVRRCMVAYYGELSSGCQRELGRSVHMSLFVWAPGGIVTAPCDADIHHLCLGDTQDMEVAPGAVEACLVAHQVAQAAETADRRRRQLLADQPKQQGRKEQAGGKDDPSRESKPKPIAQLSEQCYQLVAIASPPHMQDPYDMQSIAYSVLTKPLEKIQQTTGLQTLETKGRTTAISLTGWTALAGIAALVVVLLAGATYGVRQYFGGHEGYTLVMKQAPAGTAAQ